MSTTASTAVEHLLQAIFMYLTARGIITHDESTSLLADMSVIAPALFNVATLLYAIYSRWNTKRVSADARVIDPAKVAMVLLAGLLLMPGHAEAGDVAPRRAIVIPASQCTLASCVGFYGGVGFSGIAQGADILGQGFQNTITAGGSIIDAHLGAIYSNGTYLAGAEFGIGYQVATGVSGVFDHKRLNGYEDFFLGGQLAPLLGIAPPAQSSGTFNLGAVLANSAPFVHVGAWQRGNVSQQESGVGVFLPLTDGWFVKTTYTYGAPSGGLHQFNMLQLGINKVF